MNNNTSTFDDFDRYKQDAIQKIGQLDECDLRFLRQICFLIEKYLKEKGRH